MNPIFRICETPVLFVSGNAGIFKSTGGRLFLIPMLIMVLSLFNAAQGQVSNFSFNSIPFSDPDIVSPFRGAERWHSSSSSQMINHPNEAGMTPPMDIYHRSSLAWDELESSQGVYTWGYFDQIFNDAIDNNQKISFGIMTQNPGRTDGPFAGGAYMSYPLYLHNLMQSEGSTSRDWISAEDAFWVPNYNSPNYLGRFEALLNAVADHINRTSHNGVSYRDALGYVDIRGYGSWGEWHMVAAASSISDYPAGRRPLSASLIRIINAHINAFPNHPLVSIISTFDANQFGNTMVPPEVGYHALTASNAWGKIGWRRDNWGWIDGYISTWLERNPTVYNGMRFDTAIMNRWKYAPILGEGPCGGTNNGGPCAFWDVPRQVRMYHASMIGNGNFCGENTNDRRGRDSMRMAWKYSGYRLILEGGNMSTVVSPGGQMNISLNWKNVGIAPVYENWDVTYELQNQANNAVAWSGVSRHKLKWWLPQSTATIVNDSYTIPSNLPGGTYRLVVKIKDPVNYRAPLPLAIQGRRADGSYLLRADITLGAPGPANAAPSASAGADQSVTLPTNTVTLNGSGTDPDGSIASYAWTKVSGPAGGSIQSASAASTSINGLNQGTYVYRLTVTDNGGLTATDDVQVVVNATPAPTVNQAPVANAGADQTVALPTNTVTFNGSGTDPDGSIASYAWTKVSGPAGGSIQSASAASTSINGLNQGTYVYRLTVTDNGGLTATDDIQVVVNAAPAPAPNQAPVANAGADQTVALPTNTVTLNGSGSDPDGSIASFAWTKVSGPAGGSIQSASAASTSINGLNQGTYVYRLTVTDNGGLTATDDIQVVVNAAPAPAPNQAPVANAGPDVAIALPDNTITLNGAGSDADGTIQSYSWTKISGPAGGNLQSPGRASTVVTALNGGNYVFRLTVTDNNGATATDDIQVTVNTSLAPSPSNQAPVASAGSNITITLPVNSATLNGSGNDPDGSVTSFNWTKLSGPAGGNIQSANSANTEINGLNAGTYVFRLTVTDNAGAQGSADVQVIVLAAPSPVGNISPVVNAGGNISITLPVNSVNLNGSASDADGSVASYTWTKVSGPAGGNIQSPGTAATGISDLNAGTYVYRLTVTDNRGATASDDMQLSVSAAPVIPNIAPVANAGHDITITLPVTSVNLNGSVSADPDGSIVSYSWRKISGPNGSIFSSMNIASPVVVALSRGVHEFELTVTDNRGATASDRVTVTVIKINQKPVARTTRDTIIVSLPVQNAELNASDSYDPDGTITNYQWTFRKGPKEPKMLSPESSRTIVADLIAGNYEFDLVLTDNDGDVERKAVVVVVKTSSNRKLIPDVSVYPNPATNLVNIKISSEVEGRTVLTFYDMNGRPVMTDVFVKGYGSFTRQVNISRLPIGTYSVLIQVDQTQKVVEKLIKF